MNDINVNLLTLATVATLVNDANYFVSRSTLVDTTTTPAIKNSNIKKIWKETWENEQNTNVCNICSKTYSTCSNLRRRQQIHSSNIKTCFNCDKIYLSKQAFSMHTQTHKQNFQCQCCTKRFSRSWLLNIHTRTHTGEKPFKCTTCNKSFADKSNLRVHTKIHTNIKDNVCDNCGKCFSIKSYLKKHMQNNICKKKDYEEPL